MVMEAVMVRALVAIGLVFAAACTQHNPGVCNSDADCPDPVISFCDTNGEYPESGYTANRCSVKPASCPVSRCGCMPGESLACAADQATVCGPDGMSSTMEACALGCAAADPRCARFTPSNELGSLTDDSAAQPDVSLPAGAKIDTELGIVRDSLGATIGVKSSFVSQNGGLSKIFVLEAHSFVIDAVTVTGSHALAFVSTGPIAVRGRIAAAGAGVTSGPGGQEGPNGCIGIATQVGPPGCTLCGAQGAGGAGNATIGGVGGGANSIGGAGGGLQSAFDPLVGGCRGGSLYDTTGATVQNAGGGGGGAVQLVSYASVKFTSVGFVAVGAGGGLPSSGGGSGGLVVIEAPVVTFEGAQTGVAANGGGGGACNANGGDGTNNSVPATSPTCGAGESGGAGGTATVAPQSAPGCTGGCVLTFYGGGGGAAGRLRIVTKDSGYSVVGNPGLNAVISVATLQPN